jgi:hypothetical protein
METLCSHVLIYYDLLASSIYSKKELQSFSFLCVVKFVRILFFKCEICRAWRMCLSLCIVKGSDLFQGVFCDVVILYFFNVKYPSILKREEIRDDEFSSEMV